MVSTQYVQVSTDREPYLIPEAADIPLQCLRRAFQKVKWYLKDVNAPTPTFQIVLQYLPIT